MKVAWHEVQAQWRREARAAPGEVPDGVTGQDPARIVEGRLDVAAVIDGIGELSESDRRAILASLDGSGQADEPLSAAEKMRRYRARRRLAALIGYRDPEGAEPGAYM